MKKRNFINFNSLEDSFKLYQRLMPFIHDVRGERIEFDIGSYAHIIDDEQLLRRIHHIKHTLIDPDEIRQSYHKKMEFREAYINTFFEHQFDLEGEPFIVVVDKRITSRFWTAILPTPSYLKNVKRGRLIWKLEKK